jgi:ABC-2 type transport system permease protein
LTSFAGMTTLAYWDPPIRLLMVQFAIYVASEPAADVEAGLVDLLLARPLPRRFIIGRSLLLMTVLLALLVGAMGATTWVGLWLWAPAGVPWPEGDVVLLLMIHLGALSWCFGCIALAAAATVRRRASAIGLVSLISVTLFLLDVLAEFSPRFERFGWLTPFHYFHGSTLLRGAADSALDLTVFGAVGAIAVVCAFWQFNRRDL